MRFPRATRLCEAHHRAVHEGGFGLRADGRDGFIFTRPDGRSMPSSPLVFAEEPVAAAELHDAEIQPATTVPAWHGERLDLDLTIWALFGNERISRSRASSHAEQDSAGRSADDSAEALAGRGMPPSDPSLN